MNLNLPVGEPLGGPSDTHTYIAPEGGVAVRCSAWLDAPPEQEGWYWMDYGMWTPIFPAFWNGYSWENSGGVRLNVEQFEKAQWQGPIFPVGREMNKSSNAPAGSATCRECNWTNVSLLNLGEPGRARWVCQGCCKRAIEMLDKVKAALSPNEKAHR